MKKIVALVLLTIICFSICACDPASFQVSRDALNNVISVELIEYENPDQKHFTTWVPDQFDELVPFNLANATILETLPKEKIPDFILTCFSQEKLILPLKMEDYLGCLVG